MRPGRRARVHYFTVPARSLGTLGLNPPVPPVVQNPLRDQPPLPVRATAGDDPAKMALASYNTATPSAMTAAGHSITQFPRTTTITHGVKSQAQGASRNNTPVQDLAASHVVRNRMTWGDPRQPPGQAIKPLGIATDQAASTSAPVRTKTRVLIICGP